MQRVTMMQSEKLQFLRISVFCILCGFCGVRGAERWNMEQKVERCNWLKSKAKSGIVPCSTFI